MSSSEAALANSRAQPQPPVSFNPRYASSLRYTPGTPLSQATKAMNATEVDGNLDQTAANTDRSQSGSPSEESNGRLPKTPREFVRLFQCKVCSMPFQDAVSLPCGRSICKKCLPESRMRANVTYPALPDRLQSFLCPYEDCRKEHAVGDCMTDVTLNKVSEHARNEMKRRQFEAKLSGVSTQVAAVGPWEAAGISTMQDEENLPQIMDGSQMIAIWTLAEEGHLSIDAEITCHDVSAPGSSEDSGASTPDTVDEDTFKMIQQTARTEVDCQVCYGILLEPLTTGCGHTFCRSCLHRILDHSHYCPLCRRKLSLSPLLDRVSCPSNQALISIMETCWAEELIARREAAAAEESTSQEEFKVPLFICTLAFPQMPTFLYVFEPRYRLMIRNAMEGDRTFGMVLPKRPDGRDDAHFYEFGTLLRIQNIHYYPNGCSMVETVGLSRFRVTNHGSLDGYSVCNTERIDDMSLEQEEAMEAAEITANPPHAASPGEANVGDAMAENEQSTNAATSTAAIPSVPTFISPQEMQVMSTQDLMRFATAFVHRIQEDSVPWFAQKILEGFGECPEDPATFPWWLASILPVKDMEKYKLLGTSSVRERLKICCQWIIEWESGPW